MIIQVEYPKSGGTWVYKILTYYLNIPILPLLKSKDGKPLPGKIEDPEMARKEGWMIWKIDRMPPVLNHIP